MDLTFEDFLQYRARRAEIDVLTRKRTLVRDTVRGSDPEYPYCEHPVTITGINLREAARVAPRVDWLRERCAAVEGAILALEDSAERVALMMRYVDGCTWQEIGEALGASERTVKRSARIAIRIILR